MSVSVLEACDHDPWFYHKLIVGQNWHEQLSEAIVTADAFLYAITPESGCVGLVSTETL